MKPIRPLRRSVVLSWILLVTLGVTAVGCRKAQSVQANAAEMEKAFQGAQPNPLVQAALSAVKTNDFAGGVLALQEVRNAPGVSAEQLMAVQKTQQAMTDELLARAERGDASAKAALALIERTRSQ